MSAGTFFAHDSLNHVIFSLKSSFNWTISFMCIDSWNFDQSSSFMGLATICSVEKEVTVAIFFNLAYLSPSCTSSYRLGINSFVWRPILICDIVLFWLVHDDLNSLLVRIARLIRKVTSTEVTPIETEPAILAGACSLLARSL